MMASGRETTSESLFQPSATSPDSFVFEDPGHWDPGSVLCLMTHFAHNIEDMKGYSCKDDDVAEIFKKLVDRRG